MSPATVTVIGLGLISYALKAFGPVVVGGRRLPAVMERAAELIPAPLLAALVMISTIVDGKGFVFDARLAGLAAAAAALRLKANFLVTVLLAATATAITRALLG